MHFKNILILSVFIIFLVGISCVSAESADDTNDLSTGDADDVISVDESLDDDIGIDENQELLESDSSATVTTWNELNGNVSGDTGPSIVNIGANLTPGNQVTINHDVTIVGSAGTHIGGSNSSNMASYNNILFLSTKQGLSITLKNIKFQNCGGNTLIKFAGNGNYVLDNCTFENITANSTKQVIVHLNWGNCNITNCTFEKCYTDYGAVSNFKSDYEPNKVHMVVRETTFKNNYASTEPGAINNCGQLIVYDSTFENNEAFWWAGAIHTHFNANTTIVRSIFRNNHAGWNGGALYTYSYLTVLNSTFIANVADGVVSGGAIAGSNYVTNPKVVVNNSVFMYNVANQKGGAISIWDAGYLKVYNSRFVNNTEGNHLNAISYSYSGSSSTAAYLVYINNTFVGPNNASGSVTYGNSYLNVINESNNFIDSGSYIEPGEDNTTNTTNDTNGTGGDVIEIPVGTHMGDVEWSVDLGGALSGTPVISGDYIIIPASHTLYCYTVDGDYVWNVTNEYNCFHEVLVNDDVIFAPCSGDKLYILDLETGVSLTDNNIYQGSSIYAPVMDAYGNVYIASEYGYGANRNLWITVVTYENDDYVYSHSILEINNISYGSSALLSQPVITEIGYFLVNTVNGLIIADLIDGHSEFDIIEGTIGNFAFDSFNNYYSILVNTSGELSVLFFDSYLNIVGFSIEDIGNFAVFNNLTVFTVNDEGYFYFVDIMTMDTACLYINDDFHVNHVSSALALNNNILYIGDDEGKLWVVDTTCGEESTINSYLLWGFNTNSSIVGNILVYEDIVYVGTENGMFYALTY